MSTAVPIIRGEGEGERRWFAGGGVHLMKATAEETDGAFILREDRMVRGKTTPLHTHPNLDETLIVLEGEILFYAEGTEHRVGPRGVAVAPRGAPHAFMVTSESALILALQTPGSGEAFYRESGEPATVETDPGRTDWGRLRVAARRHPDIHRDPRSASIRGGEGVRIGGWSLVQQAPEPVKHRPKHQRAGAVSSLGLSRESAFRIVNRAGHGGALSSAWPTSCGST